MRKLFSAFAGIIILSCNSEDSEGSSFENESRFYGFHFIIEIYDDRVRNDNGDSGLAESFEYNGLEYQDSIGEITHWIYVDEQFQKSADSTKELISCSLSKLDSVYDAIIEKLTPRYSVNVDANSDDVFAGNYNEWGLALIELDLGEYGGNIHSVKTQEYQDILDLILR